MEILLVEDEVLTALHLAEQLGSMGHSTKAIAYNIHSALDFARSIRFEAAVLDYNLGETGTTEPVAVELRRRGIPIVWFTGSDPDCRLAGEPILYKPASLTALDGIMARLAVRRDGLQPV